LYNKRRRLLEKKEKIFAAEKKELDDTKEKEARLSLSPSKSAFERTRFSLTRGRRERTFSY
jgi:hypothetical protein